MVARPRQRRGRDHQEPLAPGRRLVGLEFLGRGANPLAQLHQRAAQRMRVEIGQASRFEGAFEYGAPPHGGIAFGFDRLCALLGGSESIRDFIAFPKNNSGRDVMLDAPSSIDDKQFEELHIKLNLK